MINSFVVVGTQVLILFILILLGFCGGKLKITTKSGVSSINDIMLYFVTPCVILDAFQRPFDELLLKNLLLAVLAAFLSHFICMLLGLIFIRKQTIEKRNVLRFAIIFSNCGFMALPLLKALLGEEGVFYGAGYVAVFNLLVWSIGQYIMSEGEGDFNIKKSILNPGVISVIIGLLLFFTSTALPNILLSPISSMASLNTPVAMLIIGYTFSTLDFKELIKVREVIPALLLRLIIGPLAMTGLLYLFGYRGTLFVACIVSVSAPVAATTTMFSIKFNKDEALASKLVALSTLLSIITMTLIVGFAQYLA